MFASDFRLGPGEGRAFEVEALKGDSAAFEVDGDMPEDEEDEPNTDAAEVENGKVQLEVLTWDL